MRIISCGYTSVRTTLPYLKPGLTCVIVRDVTGNFTQKAFIQFTELQYAVAALEAFQEKHVHGTNLKIYYAKERSRTPQPERRSEVEQIFDA